MSPLKVYVSAYKALKRILKKNRIVGTLIVLAIVGVVVFLAIRGARKQDKKGIEFERCDKTGAQLKSLELSACPDTSSEVSLCEFKRGQDYALKLAFISDSDFYAARLNLSLLGFSRSAEACRSGLACPVARGSEQRLEFSFKVELEEPRAEGEMRVNISSEIPVARVPVICVKFPASII